MAGNRWKRPEGGAIAFSQAVCGEEPEERI